MWTQDVMWSLGACGICIALLVISGVQEWKHRHDE